MGIKSATDAREAMNGLELDGRKIRVDFSITKRPHTPTPGMYMGRPTDARDGFRGDRGGHRGDGRGRGRGRGGRGDYRGDYRGGPPPRHYDDRPQLRHYEERGPPRHYENLERINWWRVCNDLWKAMGKHQRTKRRRN